MSLTTSLHSVFGSVRGRIEPRVAGFIGSAGLGVVVWAGVRALAEATPTSVFIAGVFATAAASSIISRMNSHLNHIHRSGRNPETEVQYERLEQESTGALLGTFVTGVASASAFAMTLS